MVANTFYSRVGNLAAVGWCTLCVGILGLGLLIAGAVTTGIAYTQITPPDYDENFDRYLGAMPMRIIGPTMLAFGGILTLGSCIFFGFAFYDASRHQPGQAAPKVIYG